MDTGHKFPLIVYAGRV